MKKNNYLTCKEVFFYSQIDEDAFFEWIKKMKCVQKFEGAHDELYLDLVNRDLDYNETKELIALFHRYQIDMKQLGSFLNSNNKAAMEPWREEIFGT